MCTCAVCILGVTVIVVMLHVMTAAFCIIIVHVVEWFLIEIQRSFPTYVICLPMYSIVHSTGHLSYCT